MSCQSPRPLVLPCPPGPVSRHARPGQDGTEGPRPQDNLGLGALGPCGPHPEWTSHSRQWAWPQRELMRKVSTPGVTTEPLMPQRWLCRPGSSPSTSRGRVLGKTVLIVSRWLTFQFGKNIIKRPGGGRRRLGRGVGAPRKPSERGPRGLLWLGRWLRGCRAMLFTPRKAVQGPAGCRKAARGA